MALTIKFFNLIFMAAMCFFLLAIESQSFDSKMVYQQKSMVAEMKNRKVLKGEEVEFSSANIGNENDGNGEKKEKMVEWELREAPMGPDPLHHHGGSPINRRKQPTTP